MVNHPDGKCLCRLRPRPWSIGDCKATCEAILQVVNGRPVGVGDVSGAIKALGNLQLTSRQKMIVAYRIGCMDGGVEW